MVVVASCFDSEFYTGAADALPAITAVNALVGKFHTKRAQYRLNNALIGSILCALRMRAFSQAKRCRNKGVEQQVIADSCATLLLRRRFNGGPCKSLRNDRS